MSWLVNAKKWLGLDQPTLPQVTHIAPTFEERLGEAAAKRGYAFELLDQQVRTALEEAAAEEVAVAVEAVERAQVTRDRAREDADRILERAARRSGELEVQAEAAARNARDDYRAVRTLASLIDTGLHDTGPSGAEVWDA